MRKYLIRVGGPVFALLLCAILIQLERTGVVYKGEGDRAYDEAIAYSEEVLSEPECLVLVDSREDVSMQISEQMCYVLDSMRIPYDMLDLAEASVQAKSLEMYRTIVISVENWNSIGAGMDAICQWVENGGSMMNTMTPSPSETFLGIKDKFGIINDAKDYTEISGFYILDGFMIGTSEHEMFRYVELGEEALLISLDVELEESVNVYMESESELPLIWSKDYGEGRFVCMNETLTDKYQRGFLAAAYSLLEEVCIYPVINASAFYLDDFPSPVPSGHGEYIQEEYGMDIANFYQSVWWPDIMELAQEYDIAYTALVIESYDDQVEAPLPRMADVTLFKNFGNMLLNTGGEIGIHGYNHQPLCLEGINDDMQFESYNLWPSRGDMKAALTEVVSFTSEMFPEQTFAVYVPPSNILSEEGLEVLLETCPDIRAIASMYLPSDESPAYVQEFEVDERGFVHTPRVVSNFVPDNYQMLTAMAELNFHYVQSHFCHPDDVLDEERGAALGWEVLSIYYENYISWLDEHAWNIRNTTGSEMAAAVERYDMLSVHRELEGNQLKVKMGGFADEAYFFLRIDGKIPQPIEGCSIEQMTKSLYLVHAIQDEIRISLGDE